MAGRTALVTGAGRGIGRATAISWAARGDRVLAVARTEQDLRSLAEAARDPALDVATALAALRAVST